MKCAFFIFIALLVASPQVFAATALSKKCQAELESLTPLRHVQFPSEEEREDILKALKTKDEKVKKAVEFLKEYPDLLKVEIQTSMDHYNDRHEDEGHLPGLRVSTSPKTVNELIENYIEIGVNQGNPGAAMLPNVVANMRTIDFYTRMAIEESKYYKLTYTELSPRLLDHALFELLLSELRDEQRRPLYITRP